jgi:hypothetical protein
MTHLTARRTSWRISTLSLIASVISATSVFAADTRPVTFAKDIAPLFQEKCQQCHRPGQVAPMSLLTYQDARPWARAIKQKVEARLMPPWHIDKTVGIQQFKNDISLTDDQIDLIARWVDAGAPMGDPNDLPSPRVFEDDNEWKLAKQMGGPPDLVIKAEPYTMEAQTQDKWWKPITNVDINEVRWVRAVETRTSNIEGRKILHHSVASLIQDEKLVPEQFRITSGAGATDDDDDTPAGDRGAGLFHEWAIGKTGDTFREGTGKVIVPGARISWDIHLSQAMNVKDAKPITAEVEIGVYLYPRGYTPKYRTVLTNMGASRGRGIDIPPGQIAATQGFTVLSRGPARIENFQPHMHLRGKAMALEAILPNGQRQVISFVNNFQFNWMNSYEFADDAAPIFPKGTIISVTAWHDNTVGNKNNPDPNQWVGGGDRSIDEMAHAWVNVTYLTEEDYKAEVAKRKAAATQSTDQQQQ